MIKYLQTQIEEITSHRTLCLYGAALSLTHLWTFLYWNRNGFFVSSQSGINSEPICFPWFPNCDLFRESLSAGTWQGILYAYLFMAALACCFFLAEKTITAGYFTLAGVTAFKFFLHMSNYNFMGNYHYMIYFVILAFLLVPNKRATVKHLIVAFYISAGFLKINIDWLSGAAMIRSPYIYGNILVASLFYVVVLELVFVFALLHRNQWVRWAGLLQFLAFHAFSWHIVGFFYPMMMFSVLSIFIFDEWSYWKEGVTPKNHFLNLFRLQSGRLLYSILIGFSVLQGLPFLLTSDPSLSGVARLPSLNMFDSKTHCHSLMVAHTKNGSAHIRRPMKNLGTRLKCDPLILLNQAHQLCRKNKKFQEIDRLSLTLFSKRVTAKKYKKVLDIKNVCTHKNPLWAELYQGGES